MTGYYLTMSQVVIKKLTDTKNSRKLFQDFDMKLAIYERTLDSKLLPDEKMLNKKWGFEQIASEMRLST